MVGGHGGQDVGGGKDLQGTFDVVKSFVLCLWDFGTGVRHHQRHHREAEAGGRKISSQKAIRRDT